MTEPYCRAKGRQAPRRDLHISRDARIRYGVAGSLVALRGSVVFADLAAAGSLAHRMNLEREVDRFPQLAVTAGEIYAAGLLHEAMHLLIASVVGRPDPLLETARSQVGSGELRAAELRFAERFPAPEVASGALDPEDYLDGVGEAGPNAAVVLEEMLLLRLGNENPALGRLRTLFDDTELVSESRYLEVVAALEGSVPDRTSGLEGASLGALLRAPMLASPTSLSGQLDFVCERWAPLLGERFAQLVDRMLTSIDVLREEGRPRFAGPGPVPVHDAASLRGGGGLEYERFSSDQSWMPKVVLLAKSSYVWLDQLSRRYGREIATLDAIPDEELDAIAEGGFTGLWLIGLWERSEASRRIKHLRGQPDAVASAYALYDYRIADDLGGEGGYRDLRDRAWSRGVRLASDMVPNHFGIDGRWVVEHPERFLQLDHPPYPGYTFDGPDLSADERVGIFLEDHYYDNRDAAVVFKRLDRGTGEARYIYHGNDGTSMPWNDTAQIDYLNAEAREAVIATILEVARRFPIIRFDAAMTLAKQHVQRLWFPPPGSGGAIPSRTQYGALTEADFDARMPAEFWREVVDRVAEEVPETLLLAEAFWMMEGYFVRTLGMHRVYNSAFMHMLKQERNAEYRTMMRNVLEFDPQILKRFVNFMNNPDEESAVAQFGRDSKYFGVAVVMSTLPGLPMFGHGQVEGLSEKYGMEFRRAKLDEAVDEGLVERHRREIFPLLHRREQFAEVDHFLLYDVHASEGSVHEDVFAYSNRGVGSTSLVLFHNRFGTVRGWVRRSVAYLDKELGELRERDLFGGLGLTGGGDRFTVLPDAISGTTTLVRSERLRHEGLFVELDAFAYRVYLDIHERIDTDGRLAELEAELAGRPVADLDGALADLTLRPFHDALLHLVEALLPPTTLNGADADVSSDAGVAEQGIAELMYALEIALSEVRAADRASAAHSGRGGAMDPAATPTRNEQDAEQPPSAGVAESGPIGGTELLAVASALVSLGIDDGTIESLRVAPLVERLAWKRGADGAAEAAALPLLAELLRAPPPAGELRFPALAQSAALEAALGVHSFEGVRWFSAERAEVVIRSLAHLADRGDPEAVADALRAEIERSEYRFDRLVGAERPEADGESVDDTSDDPEDRTEEG